MFPKLGHVSEVWAHYPNPFMMQVREGDRDQRNDRGHEALQAQRRRERNDLLFIISYLIILLKSLFFMIEARRGSPLIFWI